MKHVNEYVLIKRDKRNSAKKIGSRLTDRMTRKCGSLERPVSEISFDSRLGELR